MCHQHWQVCKLRHREVDWLAKVPQLVKWQSQDHTRQGGPAAVLVPTVPRGPPLSFEGLFEVFVHEKNKRRTRGAQ